jgi:hypothetical protein
MSKYKQFIFKRYSFDKASGLLELFYGYDEELEFKETYKFDFDFTPYNEELLDRAIQTLFFVAGVSYYKAYVAEEIVINNGEVDTELAKYLSNTYERGLGEFFYVNKLDPRSKVIFPINSDVLGPIEVSELEGKLIGLGGGKDSLVSVELTRDQPKVATWSLNHRSQLEPLVSSVGLPHFYVEREWDSKLSSLNSSGAYNGHVPISAIFSCVGTIVGILSGYKELIVSNESSASEPNLVYKGLEINHQYSKSLRYEKDYQELLRHLFGDSISYYSFLRPLSELKIAEVFSKIGFQKYRGVFSSCNRAFRHGEDHMFWCGECAKCAFVFLILTPFIDRSELESIWDGKNLLLDSGLDGTYRQLLGIEGDKPLDCVGEIKEARTAMRLAQEKYPELAKYVFDIPVDYDYSSWSEDSMPKEIFETLKSKLTNL